MGKADSQTLMPPGAQPKNPLQGAHPASQQPRPLLQMKAKPPASGGSLLQPEATPSSSAGLVRNRHLAQARSPQATTKTGGLSKPQTAAKQTVHLGLPLRLAKTTTPPNTQTGSVAKTQSSVQATVQPAKPQTSNQTTSQPAKPTAAAAGAQAAGGAHSQPKPAPSSQTSSASLSSTATITSTITTTTSTTTATSTSTTASSSRPSLHSQASASPGHPKDVGRQLANPFTLLEEALEYVGPQRPLYQGTLTPDRMAAMDAHARACPATATGSVAQLASYLSSAARGPEERVRAICFWLHLNVRYDTAAYFSGNVRYKSVDDVLRDRTSVCQGFANLMCALCRACYIECELVRGYAKGGIHGKDALRPEGPAYSSNHAWVVVRLYSPSQRAYSWFLVDPTWCSGHVEGTSWVQEWARQYYFADPISFAQTYFPDDPKWTLLPEEKRPVWRGFVGTVRLYSPNVWESGIVPVTHKHVVVDVPPDGRLHMVFKARKGTYMSADMEGYPRTVDASILPRDDGSGAQFLALDFTNVQRPRQQNRSSGDAGGGSGGGGDGSGDRPPTITIWGNWAFVMEYLLR